MKALCKIVRQSLPDGQGNAREAWFQLRTRLMSTPVKSKWMEKIIGAADYLAPRPWIKAITPCLKGTNDALVGRYYLTYDVHCVVVLDDEIMSLGWLSNQHDVFVNMHNSNRCDKVTLLKVRSIQTTVHDGGPWSSRQSPSGLDERIMCGAIFKDGTHAVTGWSSGTMRANGVRSGEILWQGSLWNGSSKWSVAVSEDGSRVVSGSFHGTVRMWDVNSGDHIGPAVTGHNGNVICVALSLDGRRVVSGSDDCTLRVWDTVSRKPVAKTKTGRWVRSVAISNDGR